MASVKRQRRACSFSTSDKKAGSNRGKRGTRQQVAASDATASYKAKRMLSRAESLELNWAYAQGVAKVDPSRAVLLDNVQFIYELALAEMELGAFGVKYRICNGHREFKLTNRSNIDVRAVAQRVAYFRTIAGIESTYFRLIQRNRTRSVNQYLTHWIYPYKGKFHPQMIRAILNVIGVAPGETVLDPFIGSGTTAVEAQLLGINVIGVDVSPLCRLQSWVKTHAHLVVDEVCHQADAFLDAVGGTMFASSSDVQARIRADETDPIKKFLNMALLIGASDKERRGRAYAKSVGIALRQMIESAKDFREAVDALGLHLGRVDIVDGDARRLNLKDESVDGIVTSPPYSIALDYVENDKHALRAMGVDTESARDRFIGVRGVGAERVSLYDEDLKQSIGEMARVLKSGRYAVIVIGNATYQGREVPTVNYTIAEARKIGLRLEHNINKIIFGLYNVMRQESILFFRKE